MKNFELTAGNMKSAMKSADAKSRDLWFVPVSEIKTIEGFNVRERNADYEKHIRSLADSIKANGFFSHKPLAGFIQKTGDTSVIRVTDGHSLLEAVRLAITEGAEITQIPFVAHPAGTNMEDLTVSLVTDNSGKPLNPLEISAVCARLKKFGMETSTIATRLSVTSAYVNNLLQLASAPKRIRDMVASGKIGASTALKMMREHGEDAGDVLEEAVEAAEAEGKTKVAPKALSAPKRNTLKDGVAWIKESTNDDKFRGICIDMLAALTGRDFTEIKDLVEEVL